MHLTLVRRFRVLKGNEAKSSDQRESGSCRRERGNKRERQREITLADLQRDRGGHHAGEVIDIAADNHDCADLRTRPSEPGQNNGQ